MGGGEEAILHGRRVVKVMCGAFENLETLGFMRTCKVLPASSNQYTFLGGNNLEGNVERRGKSVPIEAIDFIGHLFSDDHVHAPTHEVSSQSLHILSSWHAVLLLCERDRVGRIPQNGGIK